MDRFSYAFMLEDMVRGIWIASESMLRTKVPCAMIFAVWRGLPFPRA